MNFADNWNTTARYHIMAFVAGDFKTGSGPSIVERVIVSFSKSYFVCFYSYFKGIFGYFDAVIAFFRVKHILCGCHISYNIIILIELNEILSVNKKLKF